MTPSDFPQSNFTLKGPPDMDESQCQSIRAFCGCIGGGNLDGATAFIVAWKPNAEDLARLNAGGLIFLQTIEGLPPHTIATQFPNWS